VFFGLGVDLTAVGGNTRFGIAPLSVICLLDFFLEIFCNHSIMKSYFDFLTRFLS
jgi:hypothetical protein